MTEHKLEHLVPAQNEVGETPIWVAEERALYWIDFEGYKVFRSELTKQEKKQPFAGDLFRIKTDVKGLPESEFLG